MVIFNSLNQDTRPVTSYSKLWLNPKNVPLTGTAGPSLPHILFGPGPGVGAQRHV